MRIIAAWFRRLTDKQQRGLDYRIGWYVILATIPIGILGLLSRIRSAPPAATCGWGDR